MKFKSTRCANIWIKPEQLLDRPNSYRLKRERTYTISLSISQSSLPPTKFKPSHKLSEHFNKIRTKLFEQIVNINGKGRKFLNFSPNQHSTVRIFNRKSEQLFTDIDLIFSLFRIDRFRISRERLTESRRKLDGPSTRIKKDPIPISTLSFPYSFASHQITYSLRSEHFVPAQNHPLLSNALKIQAEEKNRFSQAANARFRTR